MSSPFASLLLLLSLAPAARADVVRDEPRGFSFTPPPRFVDFPEGKNKPEVIHSLARGQAGDGDFAVLRIETLPGRIGREPLDHAAVERAATRGGQVPGDFAYRTVKWKSFDLDEIVMHLERDEQKVVIYAVQVPLEPQAIQIFFSGLQGQETGLDKEMTALMASLDGHPSWLTGAQRSERLGFVLGVPLAIGLVLLWRRRRRA